MVKHIANLYKAQKCTTFLIYSSDLFKHTETNYRYGFGTFSKIEERIMMTVLHLFY